MAGKMGSKSKALESKKEDVDKNGWSKKPFIKATQVRNHNKWVREELKRRGLKI